MARRRTPLQHVLDYFRNAPVAEASVALTVVRDIMADRAPAATPRKRTTIRRSPEVTREESA